MALFTAQKNTISSPSARPHIVVLTLTILCAGMALFSLGLGAARVSVVEILQTFWAALGTSAQDDGASWNHMVLLNLRLPRVLFSILTGMTLGVCGAVIQTLFRNPLADPGLLGISSGASLAAAGVIVSGLTLPAALALFTLPLAAFGGGILSAAIVYLIARSGDRVNVSVMLLGGVALSSLAMAGTGLIIYVAHDAQVRDITFWSMGSLGGTSWSTLLAALPFCLAGIISPLFFSRHLNALLLGERDAATMGVKVETLKIVIVVLCAGAVGACVAFGGAIGFMGLVAPHIARLIVGAGHKFLVPAAGLIGAILLSLADTLSRIIVAPSELPVGILTAILGTPFFIYLLISKFKNEGGSAS